MLGIRRFRGTAIDLWQGDITEFLCDVMVIAANAALAGVDGAIHRATGSAVLTAAGNLPARHVVHVASPRWHGGEAGEKELLAKAYTSSLACVSEIRPPVHIAFPAISTGIYGYPHEAAAAIAMEAVHAFLATHEEKTLRRITFVLFQEDMYKIFQNALFAHFVEMAD